MLKFVCGYFLLVRKQYLPKKNLALLAQKFGKEKNCQNPFQAILRLKKTTFFMCVFPLYSEKKSETKNLVVFFYKSKNYWDAGKITDLRGGVYILHDFQKGHK